MEELKENSIVFFVDTEKLRVETELALEREVEQKRRGRFVVKVRQDD